MALPLFRERGGGTVFSSRGSFAMLAACLLAASCAPAAAEPVAGQVVQVHDGDTVTIESDGTRYKCRFLGIDAPEMSHARLRAEVEKVSKYALPEARHDLDEARQVLRKWASTMEAHAREARSALVGMVADKTVRLACDSKQPRKDRYGRLLVYLSVGQLDVNAEMIKRGLAVADTRFPCDRLEEYVELLQAAKAARVGLWSRPGDSVPAEGTSGPAAEEESVPAPARPRTQGAGGSSPAECDGPGGSEHGERRNRPEDQGSAGKAGPRGG